MIYFCVSYINVVKCSKLYNYFLFAPFSELEIIPNSHLISQNEFKFKINYDSQKC